MCVCVCVCVCVSVCVPVAVSIFSSGWREGAMLATASSFTYMQLFFIVGEEPRCIGTHLSTSLQRGGQTRVLSLSAATTQGREGWRDGGREMETERNQDVEKTSN